MKKRNLLFISLILGLGIGLFSCNIGNGGGNVSTFPATPAIVNSDMNFGGIYIGTPYGKCAAPGLDSYLGNCVILSGFTVDYDNQPTTQFVTATNVNVVSVVTQRPYEQTFDSIRINNDTLPISSVGWDSNASTTPFYEGKFFIGITCKDTNPNFRLVYNAKEDSAGIKNFYLLAQPSSSSATDVITNYAFDITSLIYSAGRDTTDTYGSKYLYIKANLKYFTGMSSGNVPIYKMLNATSNPFMFSIFQ